MYQNRELHGYYLAMLEETKNSGVLLMRRLGSRFSNFCHAKPENWSFPGHRAVKPAFSFPCCLRLGLAAKSLVTTAFPVGT